MMGQHSGNQDRLFYSFNLDEHVPADHLLRGIDRFLDLADLRQHLARFYSHTGRPSVDPELMVRMLLLGYCFGIRSERRLCEEVHLNLAYRWFCRLGLEDKVPDHSSFSKNRHGRFRESDMSSPGNQCMGRFDAFQALRLSCVPRSVREASGTSRRGALVVSARSRAVFLSYASQDARAAARICAALRMAGIMLAKMKSLLGDAAAFQHAQIYAQWGNTPKALGWLENAFRLRDPGLEQVKMDPLLDLLRKEPRFQAVMQELKVPE